MRPDDRSLPYDVHRLLRAGRGVFSTAVGIRAGVSHDRIRRLTRRGLLIRLALGVYANREAFLASGPWEQFELRSRAFVRACGPGTYASGWSAAVICGLPGIGAPPDLPQAVVSKGEGSDGNSRFGRVRAATLPAGHTGVFLGCPVTTMPRTVVDIARTARREDALIVADSVLHNHVHRTALTSALTVARGWPGVREAEWVVAHADPHAESPLETLGRLTFIEGGLPVPISNPWVLAGPPGCRVDHLLERHWLVVEGDGALKYDNRQDAGRVVAQQREREWRLREVGLDVVRYGWDLARHDRPRLAQRFRSAIANSPVHEPACPWWREGRAARRPDR